MTATIPMELAPFPIPEHAIIKIPPRARQDGFFSPPAIPLKDLPSETLEALIADWVAAVRASAEKPLISISARRGNGGGGSGG